MQGVRDYETVLRSQMEAYEKERVEEKRVFRVTADSDRAKIRDLESSLTQLRSEHENLRAKW
jgi:hypothetical protein